MSSLIKTMLRDKLRFLLIMTLSVVAFQEMYIALFPEIQKQADELNKLLAAYPESFMQAFGIDSATSMFNSIENYLSTEMFGFFWPILMIILAVSYAGYAIAGDIERGTMEIALAQPVSRIKLFVSRYIAGTIGLAFFTVVSVYSVVFWASLHGIDYQLNNYFVLSAGCLLFALSIFSLAMLVSGIFSERSKVGLITGGTVALMYVINVLAALEEKLENLKYLSFFHYYRGETLLGKGDFVEWSVPVFVGVIFVCTISAALWFKRRDITT